MGHHRILSNWDSSSIYQEESAFRTKETRKEVVGTTVTVSSQLEDHQNPLGLPIPKDLIGRLGGGYGHTKMGLADTYSQIKFVPKIQQELALSTHKRACLQTTLPFHIKSAV